VSSRREILGTAALAILVSSIVGCGHYGAERQAEEERAERLRQRWEQEQARESMTVLSGESRVRRSPSVQDAVWGNLKARLVYDGDPPARKPVKITADRAFCGKQRILLEDLVVHPASRGVASIIVWLHLSRGDPRPPVHESYLKTQKAEVTLDASRCRFDPHVCLLRTTQTLLIRNRNPIGDSAKIDTVDNPGINIMLAVGEQQRCRFSVSEHMPVHVSCSVHPWESGWLLVKNHPYMAASDQNGQFEIENLPVGTWTFQFWHEKAGYVTEVGLAGKRTTWPRGRIRLNIKPGDNDVGDVVLRPALFDN
jgi:hypothetical protein